MNTDGNQKLARLPVFPSPSAPKEYGEWRLRVGGLVRTPLLLSYDNICAMPASNFTAPFACEEGWEVEALRWSGTRVTHLLRLAGLHKDARHVVVGAGDFVTTLSLPEIDANQALLAYRLDGSPIPWEHGGPLRLVLLGGPCYQSIKWVDRLDVIADPAAKIDTARDIALGRLTRRKAG